MNWFMPETAAVQLGPTRRMWELEKYLKRLEREQTFTYTIEHDGDWWRATRHAADGACRSMVCSSPAMALRQLWLDSDEEYDL